MQDGGRPRLLWLHINQGVCAHQVLWTFHSLGQEAGEEKKQTRKMPLGCFASVADADRLITGTFFSNLHLYIVFVLCTISLLSSSPTEMAFCNFYLLVLMADGKKAARHPDGRLQFTSRLPLHSCCCLCLFSDFHSRLSAKRGSCRYGWLSDCKRSNERRFKLILHWGKTMLNEHREKHSAAKKLLNFWVICADEFKAILSTELSGSETLK